jgi:hypothetical protein
MEVDPLQVCRLLISGKDDTEDVLGGGGSIEAMMVDESQFVIVIVKESDDFHQPHITSHRVIGLRLLRSQSPYEFGTSSLVGCLRMQLRFKLPRR